MLKAVAGIFRANLRTADLAVRSGGDEFLVLLTDTTIGQALLVGEKLRNAVSSHDCEDIDRSRVTLSIGAVEISPDEDGIHGLLSRADKAMYLAKKGGRNRVVCLDFTGSAAAEEQGEGNLRNQPSRACGRRG